MLDLQRLGLKEHTGAGAVFGAEFIASGGVVIAIVSDNGVAQQSEVFADLVEASGFWNGLNQSKIGGEFLEELKMRLSRLGL